MCVIDSVQTLHSARSQLGGGLGRPGARGRRRDHAGRQAAADRGAARRPRHQGGVAGRPAGARAPRRLRAAVRGRARADLPDGARDQEPLRLHQRGGRVRDARPRAWSRCSTPRRASSPRRRGRRAAWCCARWRARGRCWSRSRRSSRPSELVPPRRVVAGLDRNRVALVLAVLGRHGGIGLGAADVFVNVVGGVRVDEPGSDLAVALAVASAAKRVALTGDDGGAAGLLRRARADRRAAHRRPRRPAAAEARRFGLAPVIEPDAVQDAAGRAGGRRWRPRRRRCAAPPDGRRSRLSDVTRAHRGRTRLPFAAAVTKSGDKSWPKG